MEMTKIILHLEKCFSSSFSSFFLTTKKKNQKGENILLNEYEYKRNFSIHKFTKMNLQQIETFICYNRQYMGEILTLCRK